MNLLGNIIWLVFGGLLSALLYIVYGLLLCITIVGIPFGLKIIRLGIFSLAPFGKSIQSDPVSGCMTTFFNVVWILLGWWQLAAVHLVFGLILFVTIIGIPLGRQHFKLAGYSLLPFGCRIVQD